MNTTPEERAELREVHQCTYGYCRRCLYNWPCPTQRLCDDADEADALRARAEAAEADNAALAKTLRESVVSFLPKGWAKCRLCWREWDTTTHSDQPHNEGCPANRPHPGDALLAELADLRKWKAVDDAKRRLFLSAFTGDDFEAAEAYDGAAREAKS